MQRIFQQIDAYWTDGGLVMLPLAAGCVVMMFYLLRVRRRVRVMLYGSPQMVNAQTHVLPFEQCRGDVAIIAALTAAAPLLGLLGTVAGMITTFKAVQGAGSVAGGELSAGISQALITTQAGLVIAIPGLFGIARIRRMMDQVMIKQKLEVHSGGS